MSNIGKEFYRKNQGDNYNFWTIQKESDDYFVIHGVVGKELQRHILKESIIKMETRCTAKLNDGYRIKPDGITTNKFLKTLGDIRTDINNRRKPMKAETYIPNSIDFPAYCQGKINGVRATAEWTIRKGTDLFDSDSEGFRFFSKEGHEYEVPHLSKYLNDIVANATAEEAMLLKTRIFDGEIYKFGLTAPAIKGAAVNKLNPNHTTLCFITFDLAEEDTQQVRFENMGMFNKPIFPIVKINSNLSESTALPIVYQLETTILPNSLEVLSTRDVALQNNFEGIILRDMYAYYGFGKRVKTMRKLKKELYGTFEIVNIYPRNETDELPQFTLRNDINRDTFEISCDGTRTMQRNVLANREKYLGKKVKIKYYERTSAGCPFHATLLLNTLLHD